MTISVDYSQFPYLITIPKSDLTFVSGIKYKITVDELWVLLRDYADSEESLPYAIIYINTPPTSSTPRIIEINENYYNAQFEETSPLYNVDITDGNSNFRDVEVKNQIGVGTNNTTGFIDPEFLESSTFIGKEGTGVTLDVVAGTDSVEYPSGTRQVPCKTEANAETITDNRGFKNVYLASDITITADHSAHPHTWFGDNPQTITITLDNACDVTGNKFQDCYITGKLDAANIIWESIVNGITNANGFIYQSTLVGPITFSADTSIERCWSAPSVASDLVTLDFDNQVIDVQLSSWNGGRLLVKNMPSGAWVHLHGSGHVEFDNTNANGANVTVYPGFHYHDNSGATWGEFHDHTIGGEVWIHNMIEDYPVDGQSSLTPTQTLYAINQALQEFARTGTTVSIKKRDGTEAYQLTLDSATEPTSSTQSS